MTRKESILWFIATLDERGFVKPMPKGELRGITEDDIHVAQQISPLLTPGLKEKVKKSGHFESRTINRFGDLYYVAYDIAGKAPPPLTIDRTQRMDYYAKVIVDCKTFALYVTDVIRVIE